MHPTLGITGGGGFLAYNLDRWLDAAEITPDLRVFRGDVRVPSEVRDFCDGLDVLIHLAARTGTGPNEDRAEYFAVNVGGTQNVLAGCAASRTKMIHVSTGEIHSYSTPYADSKRQADEACQEAQRAGQDVVIARPFSLYGYRQNPAKLIPRFIRLARAGEPLPIQGGSQKRDYVFGVDCAEALWGLQDAPGGSVVDIATGVGTNIETIADIIIEEVRAPNASRKDIVGENRPGEPDDHVGSPAEIEALVGWKPRHDLRTGIKKTIVWYDTVGHVMDGIRTQG